MSFLGYPKVIPCTKFKHFRIFRFWIIPQQQTNRRTRTSYPRHQNVGAGNDNNAKRTGYNAFCSIFQRLNVTLLLQQSLAQPLAKSGPELIKYQNFKPLTDKWHFDIEL